MSSGDVEAAVGYLKHHLSEVQHGIQTLAADQSTDEPVTKDGDSNRPSMPKRGTVKGAKEQPAASGSRRRSAPTANAGSSDGGTRKRPTTRSTGSKSAAARRNSA
jgi:hypothetical protein